MPLLPRAVAVRGAVGAFALSATLASGLATSSTAASSPSLQATTLSITVASGYRLEQVGAGYKMPRAALQTDADTAYVVEFGSWTAKTGALYRLRRSATTWKSEKVLSKLDRPLGLVLGPDGLAYVGEVAKVSRFDPHAATVKLEKVIGDLPGKGLHPLTSFVFTSDKQLVVNVGSDTNNCEKSKGKKTCGAAEGKNPTASLRRYSFDWSKGKATGFTTIARGLRNSAGLAVHPSGTLMEAENGRDTIDKADPKLSDRDLPHDELNVITEGSNYGWPYCYDNAVNSPEFRSYACGSTVKPHVLLPAHAAPLGVAYWQGMLVVAYHGYRATGHRLVGFPIDSKGLVTGPSRDILSGWEQTDTQGYGGPTNLSVGVDGALWLTDDRNGVVLRLTAGG